MYSVIFFFFFLSCFLFDTFYTLVKGLVHKLTSCALQVALWNCWLCRADRWGCWTWSLDTLTSSKLLSLTQWLWRSMLHEACSSGPTTWATSTRVTDSKAPRSSAVCCHLFSERNSTFASGPFFYQNNVFSSLPLSDVQQVNLASQVWPAIGSLETCSGPIRGRSPFTCRQLMGAVMRQCWANTSAHQTWCSFLWRGVLHFLMPCRILNHKLYLK